MVMFQQTRAVTGGGDVAALIARVRDADQAAARELVALVRDIVVRIARKHRPRRATEDDIVQEVFMKIFARLAQYRGDAPFEHWVARIATTTCMDQLRAQRCRPELRVADLSESEALAIATTRRDPHALLPGQALATHELLHQLLDRLRPEDRQLVVWFDLEDRTIAEIEDLTGRSFDFIKMRLFRARRKLKRFFSVLPGFDGPMMRPDSTRWSGSRRRTFVPAGPVASRAPARMGPTANAIRRSSREYWLAQRAASRALEVRPAAA